MSKAKDNNRNINTIKEGYYSEELEEYTFTVGEGKNKTNVIVKLDIKPEDDISNEAIAEGLVEYISVCEEIITCLKK